MDKEGNFLYGLVFGLFFDTVAVRRGNRQKSRIHHPTVQTKKNFLCWKIGRSPIIVKGRSFLRCKWALHC